MPQSLAATTSQPAPSPVSCAERSGPGGQRATPPPCARRGCSLPGRRALPPPPTPHSSPLSCAAGKGGPGASGPPPPRARSRYSPPERRGPAPPGPPAAAAGRGSGASSRRHGEPLWKAAGGLHRLVHVRLQGRTTEERVTFRGGLGCPGTAESGLHPGTEDGGGRAAQSSRQGSNHVNGQGL